MAFWSQVSGRSGSREWTLTPYTLLLFVSWANLLPEAEQQKLDVGFRADCIQKTPAIGHFRLSRFVTATEPNRALMALGV